MTEQEMQEVFTPFNRSKNTCSTMLNQFGNGVGLSICKKICNELEGDISVQSSVQRGSIFTFAIRVYFDEAPCNDRLQIQTIP